MVIVASIMYDYNVKIDLLLPLWMFYEKMNADRTRKKSERIIRE